MLALMTKRDYYFPYIFLGSLLLLFFSACTPPKKQDQFIIGFSQCTVGTWRDVMLEEMKRELSFHPGVSLLFKQAEASTERQISQVKELIRQNIDLLIVSPNEAGPLTLVVEEAFNKGIPVIVIDRKISSSSYTAYVGGDNYGVGRMAGEYAANLLKGKGNIIEVTILPGSSNAAERHQGFADALKNYPSLHLLQQVNGEWLKEEGENRAAQIIQQNPDIDLVFAQNDFLALRVADVYKRKNLKKPMIIGVDGLPGKGEGMELVADKTITATMIYATGGEEAIQVAMKILNKQKFERENLLQTTVIDSNNIRTMQLQAVKTASQQRQIERQETLLAEQIKIYNNQRTFLYILVSFLILSVALGGLSFYSQRENRKINEKLRLQNLEILEQKNQLEILSAKAQAANEAKVDFFTNISHEFRTPLTLILGPLEELLALGKYPPQKTTQSLSLVQKNAIRLLRLVNQLMDFRKIEVEKMKVRASENDLIAFVSGIVEAYKSIAHDRNIDLRLMANERQLNVWMDVNMMDKVIFNLLSNAFKFTNDNGFIYVHISKSENGQEALIKVEDNGAGMSKEALEHAFEVFYQGDYENYKGSGLGLALSKELIRLHQGTISVSSEKWKGTTFVIRLPLGNAHLKKEEMVEGEAAPALLYEQEKIYTSDLMVKQAGPHESDGKAADRTQSVLIIEDNEDLRTFVAGKLGADYQTLEAGDGESAEQQAFDHIPDLIICDVVIPGKNGLELTNLFKNDLRTSHIPVILLTAKTNIEQQIEGMKNRADAYITKPFNIQFLEQTVKSLLVNRALLKEHFTGDLSSQVSTQAVGKLDRKFLNEFTTLVESNLSNEDFSVDEICKAMRMSKGLLYKKVKALLNLNVNDYILNARMQKAKYYLEHEKWSIGEIASKVGFSSATYFSTVFKSKFGLTPKAFKEQF
jgi:signal transduction histidine kinase/DNA-binding response OmpR family regulator